MYLSIQNTLVMQIKYMVTLDICMVQKMGVMD